MSKLVVFVPVIKKACKQKAFLAGKAVLQQLFINNQGNIYVLVRSIQLCLNIMYNMQCECIFYKISKKELENDDKT
jgi:hypothetical protein